MVSNESRDGCVPTQFASLPSALSRDLRTHLFAQYWDQSREGLKRKQELHILRRNPIMRADHKNLEGVLKNGSDRFERVNMDLELNNQINQRALPSHRIAALQAIPSEFSPPFLSETQQ
jgi:hypothetical protein